MAAETVRRAGFTYDASGHGTTLGYWPDDLDKRHTDAGGWVGRLRSERVQLLRIAKRHHEQNQAIAQAKATGAQPQLPEPVFRMKQAREDQKFLTETQGRVAEIAGQAQVARLALKPVHVQDR